MTTGTIEAQLPLTPVQASGWRVGLANLVGKEFGQWWGTKLWWIQTLVWMVILNGITTVIMLDSGEAIGADLLGEAVQTFLLVGATAIPIGVVLTIQGAVVGEKELGTAAWVMSKPASRTAYVLSKVVAHYVGFVVTALLIPGAVFAIEAALILEPLAYGRFAIGAAVLALTILFYVILTLTLGCYFKGRGPIAGIGISLILVGQFFKGMLPLPVVLATPWPLGDLASSVALATPLDWNGAIPLAIVAAETLILAYLAISRFRKEEF